VSGCAADTATFGDFHLPPGTIGISTLPPARPLFLKDNKTYKLEI